MKLVFFLHDFLQHPITLCVFLQKTLSKVARGGEYAVDEGVENSDSDFDASDEDAELMEEFESGAMEYHSDGEAAEITEDEEEEDSEDRAFIDNTLDAFGEELPPSGMEASDEETPKQPSRRNRSRKRKKKRKIKQEQVGEKEEDSEDRAFIDDNLDELGKEQLSSEEERSAKWGYSSSDGGDGDQDNDDQHASAQNNISPSPIIHRKKKRKKRHRILDEDDDQDPE